ncbi:MAG: DUF3180 domain-containing protein [Streptosporangiaceae bacterium]
MKASRPAHLLAFVLVPAILVWVLLRVTYASLPPLPWTAVPTLLLVGLAEMVTGLNTRARIHHRESAEKSKPIDPLAVARLAALGKASAHAAAVLAGTFLGFVAYLGGELDKSTPRSDFIVSAGTFLAALALVGAALFLEYCCRVPKDPEDARS